MYNFKKLFTYLVVGALVIALSISCKSNEDPGSGGDGPLEVSEQANNSYDITVMSSSSSVSSAGNIGFSVSGASDYNVSIQSVDNSSNPLILDASDFSYNKSTKELTLISSGITKLKEKEANLTEATAYQYTITFKFVDSSDTSKEKTIDVKVNLYKAKVITKDEIQAMIKSMKTVRVRDASYKNVDAQFSFSDTTFQNSEPNFKANNIGSTEKNIKFRISNG